MGSLVLLDLMGGVALLLWGLHMVHSGVLRAFGPDLRRGLAKALRNRFTAFAAGVGLTALLQSSTATALITSSFAAEGLVGQQITQVQGVGGPEIRIIIAESRSPFFAIMGWEA